MLAMHTMLSGASAGTTACVTAAAATTVDSFMVCKAVVISCSTA
jgi:hypothetical protein